MGPAATAPVRPEVRPGDGILVSIPDGTARLGMRLHDGLAVCAEPLPPELDASDPRAAEAWFCAGIRIWILVAEASPAWVFARWMPGGGRDPRPYLEEEHAALIAERGEVLLDVAEAACTAAGLVFQAWDGTVAAAWSIAIDTFTIAWRAPAPAAPTGPAGAEA